MARETKGRMLNRDIANSNKFAKLSPEAAVLFCMIIPHLSGHGKLNGGAGYLKDEICPKIPYLTLENIPRLMLEITTNTSMKWFKDDGRYWIHSTKHLSEHQNLNLEKLGTDKLPNYSGVTPELVIPEVEVEVKGEEEGEDNPLAESDESLPALVPAFSEEVMWITNELARLILANNPKNRELQESKREVTVFRWAKDIDKMIRLDNLNAREIAEVVRWCQRDSFWSGNILSGKTLREQYDKLVLKVKGTPTGVKSSKAEEKLQRTLDAGREFLRMTGGES